MRILHVANFTRQGCGISNWAVQLSTALRRAGAEVLDWDATYPELCARGSRGEPTYLPDDAADYDVVHLNWHPIALNTYGAGHFDPVQGKAVTSVFLHDLPPWSGCPCESAMAVKLTSGPYPPATLVLPYPIPDWITDLPEPAEAFTVGWTGIRGDGLDAITEVCTRRGWALNLPTPGVWLSLEDEIRRLARSSVNVCWYHEQRGDSDAVSVALGSRRPVLINGSRMLDHMRGVAGVIDAGEADLETALERVSDDWAAGPWPPLPIPYSRSWTEGAERVLATWKAAQRG